MALLVNPNASPTVRIIGEAQEAARAKGLQIHILKAETEGDFETAFASLVQLHAGALLVGTDAFFLSRRDRLVALATRDAVPAMYEWREFTAAGGLISYGTSLAANSRLQGVYVGTILKGAKPADLPVQQSTKIRAGHQSQDRQGARPDDPAIGPRPRRRGDRMKRRELVLCPCWRDLIWRPRLPRAAEGDAGDRLPQRSAAKFAPYLAAFRTGTGDHRLCRGSKCGDRNPRAEGPFRSAARIGRRLWFHAMSSTDWRQLAFRLRLRQRKRDLGYPDRLSSPGADPVAQRPRRQL